MVYTQIELLACSGEKAEVMVAILNEIQYEGFEETDSSLKAFIPKEQFKESALQEAIAPFELKYTTNDVAQQNWNADWESSFSPVIVDEFAVVRANFHEPIEGIAHDIIVTPKMSFGTGHHATTFMMMQQMSSIDFTNKTVYDFGTGTGVLAILAEKLGATSIMAIDNDEWSIENSRENVIANNCTKIDLILADRIAKEKPYEVVLANINLNVIVAAMPELKAISQFGTILLFSGFLPENEQQLTTVFAANGLKVVATQSLNNWLCIKCICE